MSVESKPLSEAPLLSGSLSSNDKFLVEAGGSIRRVSPQNASAALGDIARLGVGYGVCSTAGGTSAKTVAISDFLLLKNAIVSVLFQKEVFAGATLNVSNSGAKPIFFHGYAIEDGIITNGTMAILQYDGTNWNVVSHEFVEGGLGDEVDLGLPSGLLWATKNVGASTPEGIGYYFSWGNPEPHAEGSGYNFSQAVYDETVGASISANLTLAHDMAHANLGGNWRMPTSAEFQELYDNCECTWTSLHGMNGRLFTSKINGKSVFFPAAGYYDGTSLSSRGSDGFYWSSTWYSATNARYLYFYSSNVSPQSNSYRRCGFSVRAVQ